MRPAETAPSKRDAATVLTSKGLDSICKLVSHLEEKEFSDLNEIRHSPHAGSRETARQLKKTAGIKAKLKEVPLLGPYDDFRTLAHILESNAENLLIVGNQPNLGMLATYLLTRKSQNDLLNFKKSGMLCLESTSTLDSSDDFTPHWQIRWFINPRIFRKKPR